MPSPTGIERATGAVQRARPSGADQTAYRSRIALALGDGYEMGRLLGRGGFAEVYAARDVRLKRDIAVKVLRYDLDPTATLLQRFIREAESVAQLRHPNVVPIYSVGETDGIAYFIMPLVRGETLRAVLEREKRLPVEEARRILLEAAGALHEAHRSGIVHRDIKPDNIMLEGDERRVLLMDFGIAKAVHESDVTLTGTGLIIGTPQYMSPEQASAERSVDFRSDFYSLGIVGFQMLAGELPFTATSVVALLMKHAVEEVPSLARLRPDCPASLVEAVERCLAKQPGERWESAAALRSALLGEPGRHVPTTPGLAPGGGRAAVAGAGLRGTSGDPGLAPGVEGAPQPVRRFRRVAGLAIAAVLVLVIGELATRGTVKVAPFGAAIAAFVVAAAFGRLRFEGYGWGDAWGKRAERQGGREAGSPTRASGEHLTVVQRVHTDRAAVLGMMVRLSNAERAALEEVLPASDRLLSRATDLARQLESMERKFREIEPELRGEVSARRAALLTDLNKAAQTMHAIRLGVRRVSAEGTAGAAEAIRAALDPHPLSP